MEFTPGSVHKGTPTFSNPKTAGFDYTATLYMGAGWMEMASASFHLDAGQSKGVDFSVTMPATVGTYPVYFKVTSGGVLIGTFAATEGVTIVPKYVEIRITSPKYNPINWYAQLFSVATKRFVTAVSGGGLSPLSTPTVFDIPPGQYLLYVQEFTMTGGWWLGPYLANIPATGVYTWNSVAETLNGIKLTSLASLPTGDVIGVLQQRSYEAGVLPGTMGWIAQLFIQDAAPGTAAYYFIGTSIYIKDADLPRYGDHTCIIPVGSTITGTLDMYWLNAAFGTVWRLRNVTYPLEYSSSAYAFSGSIARYSSGKVVISCSGNVSPFRVVKITRDPTSPDYPQAGWWQAASLLGPVSGYVFDDSYIEGDGFIHQLWAHPNPNKVYNALTAGVNHWVKVAEIRT